MRWKLLALALTVSSPAQATEILYNVTLTGTLTQQIGDGPAPLSVGSVFSVSGRFPGSRVYNWGNTGFQVVSLYRYGQPNTWLTITSGAYTWRDLDDHLDGWSTFTVDRVGSDPEPNGMPFLIFRDGRVFGLAGNLDPSDGSEAGALLLGSSEPSGELFCLSSECTGTFSSLNLSSNFRIWSGYYSGYQGPEFIGQWDFARSSVTGPIPEPSAWAMMILGFGMAGYALRRRRRQYSIA